MLYIYIFFFFSFSPLSVFFFLSLLPLPLFCVISTLHLSLVSLCVRATTRITQRRFPPSPPAPPSPACVYSIWLSADLHLYLYIHNLLSIFFFLCSQDQDLLRLFTRYFRFFFFFPLDLHHTRSFHFSLCVLTRIHE